MRRFVCAALASLALVFSGPALAQDEEEDDEAAAEETEEPAEPEPDEPDEVDYNRPGLYLGLGGTWAVEEFDGANDWNIDDTIGANARVGYRVLSWLSGELMGEYACCFDIDFGPQNGSLQALLIGGNVRLNLPTDLIQPYLIAGGGFMNANMRNVSDKIGQEGNGGFARVGAGMELYPWPWLALDGGLTYVLPTGEIDDLSFLSINWGVLYRF